MEFKLLDTNRFYLIPKSERFIHIASIASGLREYILFIDKLTQQAHCEEITTGQLKVIDDDVLFEEIMEFVSEKKLLFIYSGAPDEEQPFTVNTIK